MSSFTIAFALSILASLSATIAIASATRSMSSVLKPRVVQAGVPRRTPLVTNGDLGSRGTVFLFAVILARSMKFAFIVIVEGIIPVAVEREGIDDDPRNALQALFQ